MQWSQPAEGQLCDPHVGRPPRELEGDEAPEGAGGGILTWVNFLANSPFKLDKYWEIIVGRGLGSAFPGAWLGHVSEANADINPSNVIGYMMSNTYGLLGTANLWIGVAVGLAFLAGAVKMRRYRDEG